MTFKGVNSRELQCLAQERHDTIHSPAIINMMPEVRVMLAFAESSMLPIRMHFKAKMHTRRPRIPRTIPTIMRALTAWNIAAK